MYELTFALSVCTCTFQRLSKFIRVSFLQQWHTRRYCVDSHTLDSSVTVDVRPLTLTFVCRTTTRGCECPSYGCFQRQHCSFLNCVVQTMYSFCLHLTGLKTTLTWSWNWRPCSRYECSLAVPVGLLTFPPMALLSLSNRVPLVPSLQSTGRWKGR